VGTEHISFSSELGVNARELLSSLRIRTVNAELGPWIRMTAPLQWAQLPIVQWPARTQLFKSWILLLGILPIDRHAFYLHSASIEQGFDERSSSIINRSWKHQRLVQPTAKGCTVTDIVSFECRLPLFTVLLKPVYRLVFKRRHDYLRRIYGVNQ